MEKVENNQMKEKTICLTAIMKNEEKTLPRLFESCAPICDYFVIVDTGSEDRSIELVKELSEKHNLPGDIHERPWVNFGHNRTELIGLAFGKADYLLLMDCDMTVHPTEEFDKAKLVADAYDIRYIGDLDFAQQLFVSGRKKWRYEGVVHEYITLGEKYSLGDLRALPVKHHFDGGMRHEKLERDRRMLEQDILENPGNGRSYFYLAQTYNNLKMYEQAYKYYLQRIRIGGWEEEVYYSKYQAGLMLVQQNKKEEAKAQFLDAWEFRPTRIEALYVLGSMAREEQKYNQAAMYLEKVVKTPYPANDRLFIHKSIHDHLCKFELAIACFYTGRIEDARVLNDKVIANPNAPQGIKDQAKQNQKHVLQKLGMAPDGTVQNDFFVTSFFTKDTEYAKEAKQLAETCMQHKISHEIFEFQDQGSWEKNTQMKAIAIQEALRKYQKPLVWVDADARFKKFPDLFKTATADVMYHYIKEWNEILVGTLWFANNEKTRAFVQKWIELNATNDKPDGENFQELIVKDTTLSKGILPKEYCCIFDNEHTVCTEPVVLHTQASRRNKGKKPAAETASYKTVVHDLFKGNKKKSMAVIGNGPFVSDLSKEIGASYVMRCNDFKVGSKFKGIGKKIDLNISSLYHEIIPQGPVSYPVFGILPITDTGYQKYTTAKEMHKFWKENAEAICKHEGNIVVTYDDTDRFFHEVFLPIAEGIKAFPTVGILAIGFARWMNAEKIIISGFTFFESEKINYYKDDAPRPSSHHNPFKEKLLLRSWIESDTDTEYVMDALTRKSLYDYKEKKWATVSQPFEINWHKTQDDWRPKPEEWEKARNNIFEANPKLKELNFEGLECLDIGCGPRSMLEFLDGCKKTYIEPLGKEYQEMYDFLNGDPMYDKPAEEFIPELEGKFNFVWCHNVLDHCWDWRIALENIMRYLKPEGAFYIATDAGFPPNDGHPGIESTRAFMRELERYNVELVHEDVREPLEERERRAVKEANHQIRSINLIGKKLKKKNAINTKSA